MRNFIVLLLVMVILQVPTVSVFAQAKLEKLMNEREKMHSEWKASESKKTGIFGNRTKKDMIETNEWMERIILKDNQIMKELKLLSEIEKSEITYEKNDYKFIVQKQEREIAILKRALEEKENSLAESSATKGRGLLVWLFVLVTLFLGWKFWRKKSASSF